MNCYLCSHMRHEGRCNSDPYCICYVHEPHQGFGLDEQIFGIKLI